MSGGWWQLRPEHCECTIEVVEVESDGRPIRGCVDDDCRCTVCGCEALREDEAAHGPCCDEFSGVQVAVTTARILRDEP